MTPWKLQRKTAGSQGGLEKSRLWQNMWGRSAREKKVVGKKCPLNTVSLMVKLWKNEELGLIFLLSSLFMVELNYWKNGCTMPAIAHGMVRDEVEKQWTKKKNQHKKIAMNQEQQPISQKQQLIKNNNQHHKNLTGSSPKKVPSLGVFVEFTKGTYLKRKWLQICHWYYLYIWYCFSFGGDLDTQ